MIYSWKDDLQLGGRSVPLRMIYLPDRVDDKLTSVMCDLRFASLRGAGMGAKTYRLRSGTQMDGFYLGSMAVSELPWRVCRCVGIIEKVPTYEWYAGDDDDAARRQFLLLGWRRDVESGLRVLCSLAHHAQIRRSGVRMDPRYAGIRRTGRRVPT